MKNSKIKMENKKLNSGFKNQTGASLIIALVLMVGLFLIVTGALRFQRTAAENISQSALSSQEKWAARSLTSRAGAWAITKLPQLYKTDLAAAIGNCNYKNLPSFNPAGDQSPACEKSYLGSLENWLAGKESAAVAFATANNPAAKVAVKFSEIYRSENGNSGKYVVGFLIDAGNGINNGTDTNQSEIVLGSEENCNCEIRLTSSAASLNAGDLVGLTAEFWNVEKIELFENGILIDSSLVTNQKTSQVKSWSRVVVQNSEYVVRGSVAALNCTGSSNLAVVSIGSRVVPTPSPTPVLSPTPTVSPTPVVLPTATPTPSILPTPTVTPTPEILFPTPTPSPTPTPIPIFTGRFYAQAGGGQLGSYTLAAAHVEAATAANGQISFNLVTYGRNTLNYLEFYQGNVLLFRITSLAEYFALSGNRDKRFTPAAGFNSNIPFSVRVSVTESINAGGLVESSTMVATSYNNAQRCASGLGGSFTCGYEGSDPNGIQGAPIPIY
jgi:Tfp pilus assembly protein PilV